MVHEVMRLLGAYVAEGSQARLPESVLIKARVHTLDALASCVSGATLGPGRMGAAFARRVAGRDGISTVIGAGLRADPVAAAFANGMAAHADETDDSHPGSLSHPGCSIVPAALAVAEASGASGASLLRAVVTGYDVGTRVVAALGLPVKTTGASAFSTHSYVGLFGSAAAASVVHDLDERGARHALAYAAQSASGTTVWTRDVAHVEKAFVFGGMRPPAFALRSWSPSDAPV